MLNVAAIRLALANRAANTRNLHLLAANFSYMVTRWLLLPREADRMLALCYLLALVILIAHRSRSIL